MRTYCYMLLYDVIVRFALWAGGLLIGVVLWPVPFLWYRIILHKSVAILYRTGHFQEPAPKLRLHLFQNSLLREVETAKKQLEEAQHDKVLSSLTSSGAHRARGRADLGAATGAAALSSTALKVSSPFWSI